VVQVKRGYTNAEYESSHSAIHTYRKFFHDFICCFVINWTQHLTESTPANEHLFSTVVNKNDQQNILHYYVIIVLYMVLLRYNKTK